MLKNSETSIDERLASIQTLVKLAEQSKVIPNHVRRD